MGVEGVGMGGRIEGDEIDFLRGGWGWGRGGDVVGRERRGRRRRIGKSFGWSWVVESRRRRRRRRRWRRRNHHRKRLPNWRTHRRCFLSSRSSPTTNLIRQTPRRSTQIKRSPVIPHQHRRRRDRSLFPRRKEILRFDSQSQS